MHYVEPAVARKMKGLRLALTVGVPGPWSEAAKKIFEYKGVPYIPVAQYAGQVNADLAAWTGTRNAPAAMYEDEPARTGWYDILMLGERLAPQRPLLPACSEERLLAIGISAEICSEWGFGWTRRMMMYELAASAAQTQEASAPAAPLDEEAVARMRNSYTVSVGGAQEAAHRAADIVRMLATRLREQRLRGSGYLVGASITACDIYWAAFSSALQPLPESLCPMPVWMRKPYQMIGPVLAAAKDPILIEHRDFIYAEHLKLPLDF